MNSVISGSEDALDICTYDIEKCFDALWTYECINDLFEAGMINDKLPLLFKMNINAQVAIKASQGITERTMIIVSRNTITNESRHINGNVSPSSLIVYECIVEITS